MRGALPTFRDAPDIEFKFAEIDVAGIVQKTLDLFHTGPTLEGALLNTGKATELTVHYEESGFEHDWLQSLESGTETGINTLAHTIVLARRQRDTAGFESLGDRDFPAFVRGLREYHAYLRALGTQMSGESKEHLTAAINEWNQVVQVGTSSPRVFIYLASALVLASRFSEAEQALDRAQASGPSDQLVKQKEPGLRLAIANSRTSPAVTGTQNAAIEGSILDQMSAKLIHLREAIESAGPRNPVTVAILSTGYARGHSDRVLPGISLVKGEEVQDDFEDYGGKLASLVLVLLPWPAYSR